MNKHFHTGKHFLLGFIIILGVVFADQYTKWLMMEVVARFNGPASTGFIDWLTTVQKVSQLDYDREHFTYRVVTPFLNLALVWNQGISFGLFNNRSSQAAVFFSGLSLMIAVPMTVWIALTAERLTAIALSLIVGGAFGNVIDRVRFDAVEDFLDFHWEGYHWPAFNIADSCIVLGAFLLILQSFRTKKKT